LSAHAWRVALVTGGGTGIGRGIALALARREVAVALVGRRQEPLTATVAELHSLGQAALGIAADLSDPDAWLRVIEQVHGAWGPIDTLVHNAGILAGGALLDQSPATVQQCVTTNFTAPLVLTRLLLPDLIAQRGRVVLVGSTTSFVPLPYLALYGATKAGLHHFGTALRHELTPLGVQLLIAYPPATATAMTAPMAARTRANTGRQPILATPEQIGETIVRALAQGKRETLWWGGEHLLRICYRLAPQLIERLLFAQRRRFQTMVGSAGDAVTGGGDGTL
jgi:short-subunit dehydrogenase